MIYFVLFKKHNIWNLHTIILKKTIMNRRFFSVIVARLVWRTRFRRDTPLVTFNTLRKMGVLMHRFCFFFHSKKYERRGCVDIETWIKICEICCEGIFKLGEF